MNYNKIDYKDDFMGCTYYLDGILKSHLTDSVMFGVDSYLRAFITLKIKYQYDLSLINESSRHLYSDTIYKGVVTLFQRYSDDSNKWTYGTCYRLHEVFSTGLITKTTFNHIQILIKNKFVITENKKIWLI